METDTQQADTQNGHPQAAEPCYEAFADGQKRHPRDKKVHAHADVPQDLPKVPTWGVLIAAVLVIAALVGLFFVGWVPRQHRLAKLDEETSSSASDRPIVDVTQAKRSPADTDVTLPAEMRPYQETTLFPRVNGYLKRFTVDIGDAVKQGQVLAEIDAPDVDAQLLQARAAVGQAEANLVKGKNDLELTQATLARYEGFAKTGGVTQQQIDEKRAAFTQAQSTYAADQANVAAAKADVQRLESLQGFEKIYAPFDGVVTARNFDVGALMSSGNNTTPLFRVTDTHALRVFANVPQPYVGSVNVGDAVKVGVRNLPGRTFEGKVTRTAGALDPATRTLRYEIEVPNKDGALYAGMYAEAHFKSVRERPPIVVPTSAVVFDASGTKVWVLDAEAKVHAKAVDVGRDFGTEMEVTRGLEGDERVVTNPGASLAEGLLVDAHTAGQQRQQQAAAR